LGLIREQLYLRIAAAQVAAQPIVIGNCHEDPPLGREGVYEAHRECSELLSARLDRLLRLAGEAGTFGLFVAVAVMRARPWSGRAAFFRRTHAEPRDDVSMVLRWRDGGA
jgi:hypothetical protein